MSDVFYDCAPQPSPRQKAEVAQLVTETMRVAERIGADASSVVSASMSIIGCMAISTNTNNQRAIVQSLRGLADLIEQGELKASDQRTLATAKASSLH